MSEPQVTIGSKRFGLHARPASLFAKAVLRRPGVPVQIAKDGKPPVNAASKLSLLTLGAEFGDSVTPRGQRAEAALADPGRDVGRDLDEE